MAYFPQWLENAIADAQGRSTRRENTAILGARSQPGRRDSEFGKPRGDVSVPTPGRHTPKPVPHIEVSHNGPRPSVNDR